MIEYATQTAAFISLARALFGDFDIDEVMEKSSGFLNVIFFIAYLFVAVFILLSMFFAILGESQANVREDQRNERTMAKSAGGQVAPEYGIITTGYEYLLRLAARLPHVGKRVGAAVAEKKLEEIQEAIAENGPSAVDRVEARQLEMLDTLTDTFNRVDKGLETITGRCDQIASQQAAAAKQARSTSRSSTAAHCAAYGFSDSPENDGCGGGSMTAIIQMLKAQQQQQQQLAESVAAMQKQIEAMTGAPQGSPQHSSSQQQQQQQHASTVGGHSMKAPRRRKRHHTPEDPAIAASKAAERREMIEACEYGEYDA